MSIIISLVIGAIGSLIAAFVYVWIENRKFQKRYGHIDGLYDGFSKENKLLSSAQVTYIHKNFLEISVNESENSDNIWIGYISLHNEKNGTVDWFYIQPDRLLGRFGLKKIIITDKDNFKLIGDEKAGYGVEIFKRSAIKEEREVTRIKRLGKYYSKKWFKSGKRVRGNFALSWAKFREKVFRES